MTARKAEIGEERAIKPRHPAYVRLPREGEHCPYTDMPRGTLKDLCVPSKANNFRPPVKSISLKKSKHAKRGIRLIDFNSLMKYLRSEFKKAA